MKKELNTEINVLPILNVMSIMICFLLLTAVWVQLGSLDVKQAIGDNSTSGSKNPPSLWATINADNSVEISLRDIEQKMELEYMVRASRAGIDWTTLESRLQSLKQQIPELKTAIIRPEGKSNYGDVIRMMDQMKRTEITDVGLSPLGS